MIKILKNNTRDKESIINQMCFIEGGCFKHTAFNKEYIEHLLNKDSSLIFYELNKKNEVIGYLILNKLTKYYYILSFAVKKEYRNKGYGKKFINIISSFSPTALHVSIYNKAAISLYEKNGFKIVKLSKNYYKNYKADNKIEHAYFMIKER